MSDAADIAASALAVASLPPVLNVAEWLQPENTLPAPRQVLENFLDAGGKMMLAAPSKKRKSFFALELAARAGLGLDFLSFGIPGPRRVLCIQPEIPAAHYQRRLARVVMAILGPGADLAARLGDRLAVVNCRGENLHAAMHAGNLDALAREHAADLLVLDPLYKFLETGAEDSQDFRQLLSALDRLAEQTGAAVLYVHHYAKGTAGDRAAIDRGAGSGWLGRDMDAGLYLDTHDTEPDAMVMTAICRNYPPRPETTVRYNPETGLFELLPDIDPVIRTSRSNGRAADFTEWQRRNPGGQSHGCIRRRTAADHGSRAPVADSRDATGRPRRAGHARNVRGACQVAQARGTRSDSAGNSGADSSRAKQTYQTYRRV